jgi:hypothetical protein
MPANGKRHWVGVWDTSKVERDVDGDGDIDIDDKTVDTNGDGTGDEFPPYSPADPDKKQFVRWLVSGDQDQLDAIADAGTLPSATDFLIFEGVDVSGNPDPDGPDSVKVPKVEVATATPGNSYYYAYWVEDEGVKADLAWNEMPAPNPSDTQYPLGEADPQYIADMARWQAARLSNTAGPDYLVFDGTGAMNSPFIKDTATAGHVDYQVTYPLLELPAYDDNADGEITDADNTNPWIAEMKKAMSVADIPLVMNDDDNHSDWLKANRHDIAMNVRGVMADVKKGGLRRDLSLAFEMDGDADFELGPRSGNTANYVWPDGELINPPTLFNQQDGEFVGGNDKLQALWPQPAGMSLTDNYAVSQTDARDGVTDGNGGLAPGMPAKERYLYRVTRNDGSPFSSQLKRFNSRSSNADVQAYAPLFGWHPNSVVRGPNWWALRDYYNLYKRVTKSGSSYALESRSYYPNNSAVADTKNRSIKRNYRAYGQPSWPNSTYHYDMEASQYGDVVFQPAKANYTPVYMGMIALYSMKVTNYNEGENAGLNQGDLTLAIDPLIYLWNPFNVTLKAERFALELNRGHGGKMSFIIEKPDLSKQKYGPAKTDIYLQKEAGAQGSLTYLIRDLVMEPGEVMIVSPGNGTDNTELHDEATPGTNLTDASGISTTWMPTTTWSGTQWTLQSWTNNVKVAPGDKVYCLYDINLRHNASNNLTNSAEHYWMATIMPYNKNILPKDMFGADWSWHWHQNGDIYADRVQQVGGNFASRIDWGFKEYFIPDSQNQLDANGDISNYPYTLWPQITLADPPAADSKFFFGINSHILKPANYTKVDGSAMPNRNAVEVFSQFNPYRTSTFVAGHRTNVLNEAYSSLSTPGSVNDYIQQVGVQFPTASGEADRGFWGETMHANGGSTAVPFAEIPTAPILSLVDFANANLSLRSEAAYKDVGNSHASIFVPGNSIYGTTGMSPMLVTTSDNAWLINDAIFDRYYLSGIAPEFTFGSGVYSTTAASHTIGLANTLKRFYGIDPSDPTQTVEPDTAQAKLSSPTYPLVKRRQRL